MVAIGKVGRTVRFGIGRNFFDRQAVINATEKTERKVLSKAGAFVRTRARSSLRKARRKRLNELTPDERQIYDRAVLQAQIQGRPKPRPWWFAPSKPGEPPRMIWGYIKKFLFFAWDGTKRTVVIGPAVLNGGNGSATAALEHGGTVTNRKGRRSVIAPRPFMRPALAKEAPNFPELFRNSIKG